MEEDEILRLLREAVEDSEWISRNYDELKKKYEGKIFAVRRKKVVAAAETVEELRKMLEARGGKHLIFAHRVHPTKGRLLHSLGGALRIPCSVRKFIRGRHFSIRYLPHFSAWYNRTHRCSD